MFEKILLNETKHSRKKPMAIAVLFEIALVVVLIFSPLFFEKDDIKKVVFLEQFFLPPSVPQGPGSVEKKIGSPAPKKKPVVQKNEASKKEILQSPTEIPKEIAKEEDDENKTSAKKETVESGENTGGIPGGKPCDSPNCVTGGTGEVKNSEETKQNQPEEKPAPPTPKPPRKGGNVVQAKLIKMVEPVYPPLALKNGIQGNVVLDGIIGIDGMIHNINVVSGHILLRQSAIDAIEQWKYEPATLNGEPIEVNTTITVKFVLKN